MNGPDYENDLHNDPEFHDWITEHEQEDVDSLIQMSDEEINRVFNQRYMVFVYGSLKRGFGNHYFLRDAKYCGNTETVDATFCMHSMGPFPAVTESNDNGYHITGELYEVDADTMLDLDKLEGNGVFYTRKLVKVYTLNGTVEAWMYLLAEKPEQESVFMSKFVYTDENLNTQEWNQY
jgi:gamma-glutamylaminecyclotransferase